MRHPLGSQRALPDGFTRQSAAIPDLEIRIAPALPLEQFFPPCPLRVFLVPNLQPTRVTLQIRIRLPLGNNAFKIVATSHPTQGFTVVLDVIAVEEPITAVANDRSQSLLAVNQLAGIAGPSHHRRSNATKRGSPR